MSWLNTGVYHIQITFVDRWAFYLLVVYLDLFGRICIYICISNSEAKGICICINIWWNIFEPSSVSKAKTSLNVKLYLAHLLKDVSLTYMQVKFRELLNVMRWDLQNDSLI